MPFVAYLLIRMGRVDETLLTSGLSHLLEHVVLSTEWPGDEFNATVTPLVTQFWFGGEQAEATDRLTQTLAAISEPPLPRIPRERRFCARRSTDAAGPSSARIPRCASARWASV